ncbi:MAG TPA: YbfB/YjiJ family MFS transporter [Burkholderiales bacterium]|nr:YbfB/YjiJ family MFS transporter [Burkholderiales bacterium]
MNIALAGLAALAVAMGIGRFAFTPLLPMMQADGGLTLAQGGYLAAANYIGYLVGALLAMRPVRSDVAIRGALLAIGGATLAMAVTHGMVAWILWRMVAGIASALALVHVSSWCLEQLGAAGKRGLGGVVFGGVGWGMALAGGACLALMSAGASASQTWIALGAASLAVTAALWPRFARRDAAAATHDGIEWTGDAVRLVLCYAAFGFGYIIPATFVPAMARNIVADPLVFGWAWPMFGMAAALSTLFAPRGENRRVWAIAALVMAAGVAAPIFVAGIAGVIGSALLVGATFMVITMVGMQEARRIGGPALMAAMTAAFATGQIAGPLAVSALAQMRGGMLAALSVAAASLVLSALALGWNRRRGFFTPPEPTLGA